MRKPREKTNSGAYYHICSRIILGRSLIDEDKKMMLLDIIKKTALFSGIEVLMYAIKEDVFHILVHILPKEGVTQEMLLERYQALYGDVFTKKLLVKWQGWKNAGMEHKIKEEMDLLSVRMCNISHFVKNIKQRFTQNYNAMTGNRGTIWQNRFDCRIVDGNVYLSDEKKFEELCQDK